MEQLVHVISYKNFVEGSLQALCQRLLEEGVVLVAEESLEGHGAQLKPFASLCVKTMLKFTPLNTIMSLQKYMQNIYDYNTLFFTQIMLNVTPEREQIRLGYKKGKEGKKSKS